MNIVTLLPLTENYTKKKAGAASLAVYDSIIYSKYKNIILGNTDFKDYLSRNYININFKKKFFFSSSNTSYLNKIFDKLKFIQFDILEIYNRPEFVHFFLKKKIKQKIILHIINDPLNLRGSKTIRDRMSLAKNCHIVFISKWTKRRFFTGLKDKDIKKFKIIPPGCVKPDKFPIKKRYVVFAGKLNNSKGFDIFGDSIIDFLDNHKDWKCLVIGDEPREKHIFNHPRLIFKGWLPQKQTLLHFSYSSICVVPSRWEEPFGRVSMEAAAFGCANIISNRGGLPETCKFKIVLKNLNKSNLLSKLNYLATNKKKCSDLQKKSYKFHKNTPQKSVQLLDSFRQSILLY